MHSSLFLISVYIWIMLSRSVCHSFKLNLFSSKFLPKHQSSVKMSVKNISVTEFAKLLNGPNRASVQIVDVREKQELVEMALHGDDIINLPLSENEGWGRRIANGEILDPAKPIVCMCKAGGRSLKAANFFGKKILSHFTAVYLLPSI